MHRVPARFPREIVVLLALSQLLLLASASIAQTSDLKVALLAKRVVVEQGKESLAPADKAKPGDVIQYEASYQNTGSAPVRNVSAIVPIPVGLTLVADSTKPVAREASLDGKAFSPTPLSRRVRNQAGVMEDQPVPLSQYRAVRWTIAEVPSGASTTVTLRARVATNGSGQ
jgi:uncharacterized repeat protein (TIGR01451 family)